MRVGSSKIATVTSVLFFINIHLYSKLFVFNAVSAIAIFLLLARYVVAKRSIMRSVIGLLRTDQRPT